MSYRTVFSIHNRYLVLLLMWVVVICAGVSTVGVPTAHAENGNVTKCKKEFFGLVPWFEYLGNKINPSNCEIKCFNFTPQDHPSAGEKCGDGSSDIPPVLLAVIDDLLRIAGLATIGFVLYGAFQYVGSQGDPDGTARAQKTIINALIGLVLAITAVAIVSFIGKNLGG